jgi:Na+-driven multidrug efflux pump
MAANLFLTIAFLKMYGGIGAAYATMIYYTISLIVMLSVLKKYIRIDASNILRYAVARYRDIMKLILR